MKDLDIAGLRLQNLLVAGSGLSKPVDVVRRLGAMQAQDFNAAKWAVALRMADGTENAVDWAVASGAIVRSWPMRRTLHFVAAEDISWMLDLLAGKVIRASAGRHEQLGLSHKDIEKAHRAIAKELKGGRHVTRTGMYDVIRQAGIDPGGYRGMHVLAHLAFEKFIIFGKPEGRQPTFVLFDEWVKKSKRLSGPEAVRELVRRYFTSHGPATVHDLNWWSGLNIADIKNALSDLKNEFESHSLDGRTYYWKPSKAKSVSDEAYLLPPFDEYTVGYKYRGDVMHEMHKKHVISVNGVFSPIIVVGGQVVGIWKRVAKAKGIVVELKLFRPLKRDEKALVHEAAERYSAYPGQSLLSLKI